MSAVREVEQRLSQIGERLHVLMNPGHIEVPSVSQNEDSQVQEQAREQGRQDSIQFVAKYGAAVQEVSSPEMGGQVRLYETNYEGKDAEFFTVNIFLNIPAAHAKEAAAKFDISLSEDQEQQSRGSVTLKIFSTEGATCGLVRLINGPDFGGEDNELAVVRNLEIAPPSPKV